MKFCGNHLKTESIELAGINQAILLKKLYFFSLK